MKQSRIKQIAGNLFLYATNSVDLLAQTSVKIANNFIT